MPLLKDGAAIPVVALGTAVTALDRQLALARAPEAMRLLNGGLTAWAFQARWVAMLDDPSLTSVWIEEGGNWEFHATILLTTSLFP